MDKRYDHTISEAAAQKLWADSHIYKAPETIDASAGPLYSIDTPPPTVSGSLHIGHIFSYTQTDILARHARMDGKRVFYPFGFDDNGLPTEKYVEKKKKVSAHRMGRSAFIELCLQETHEVEEQFKSLWQRMGLSADWTNCYSTISAPVRAISQESFIRLYEKGFVYRRYEPALYCVSCRTSVAQAELDDIELPSQFNTITFTDANGSVLPIGTTRPELLSSCVALLYHPEDSRYTHLKGTQATVPVFGHEVPVLADESVRIDKGTGLVMCCTFGDKTDIEWYKKFNLPYRQSIGLDGVWTAQTGILAGLKAPEARTRILEELQNTGHLLEQKPISHAVNVHERCKKEIEYVLLAQWFIKLIEYKKELIALADEIAWYPTFMKSRYINWVENLNWDWCISRQRFFGIPFPVWHCTHCQAIILAPIDSLPIDPQEAPAPSICTQCSSTSIIPDTDVMDTWNTSSITPYICAQLFARDGKSPFESNQLLPMGMRPQAHDIIRTWAFYTIAKTWMHEGVIPWKEIVISGHVLSTDKQKISKSVGNTPTEPEQLLKLFPADVIRYWTAAGTLGHDVAFSDNQLKIGQRLCTKLWNAFRFAHEHLHDFAPAAQAPQELGTINEWLLHQISSCFKQYQARLEQKEFSLALDCLERFFWSDFCDNYLELIKDQLFNPGSYTPELVAATKWTLHTVGLRILQLYAPYLPHITETIYGLIYSKTVHKKSLHSTLFQEHQRNYVFEGSAATTTMLITIVNQVRKLKTAQQLSLKAELATLTICAVDEVELTQLMVHEQLIKGITHAQVIRFDCVNRSESALIQENDLWHAHLSLAQQDME